MPAPKLALIVACAQNGIIGNRGDMPWRLSSDLKRFKALTMGKPVIMGRKTYDSIGRPLPGRTIIVVTRDEAFAVEGVLRASSIEEAIRIGQDVARSSCTDEIMVAGGGEIYAQTLPRAQRLYLTLVHATPEGDTSFVWDKAAWSLIEDISVPMGEKDSAVTSFQVFERLSPL